MDEMKIKLSTKFMKDMIAKLIAKVVFNKFGIKPDIQLNTIEAELSNGKIHFHIDVDGSVDEKVFTKINRLIDK